MSQTDVIKMLQKASSDTERLAALMMVAKLVRSEECDVESRWIILEAVGFQFPIRLLKSKSVAEECSSHTYPALGAMILATFCTVPCLVTHERMLSALPHFHSIINTRYDDEGASLLYDDVYKCLTCVASRSAGSVAMLAHGTQHALVTAWCRQLPGHERTRDILFCLLHRHGHAVWQSGDSLQRLVEHLVRTLAASSDQDKFDSAHTLHVLLSCASDLQVAALTGDWAWTVHKELSTILKCKLGKEQRIPALCLEATMLARLGVSWALGRDGRDAKHLLLTTLLTCVEVRMTLEDLTFDQIQASSELLSCCFSILERVIGYLTANSSIELKEQQVRQLHAGLCGALHAVLFFLRMVETQHLHQMTAPIVLAAVRVLGAWLAEESVALQDEVRDALPFLVMLARHVHNTAHGSRWVAPAVLPIDSHGPARTAKVVKFATGCEDTDESDDATVDCEAQSVRTHAPSNATTHTCGDGRVAVSTQEVTTLVNNISVSAREKSGKIPEESNGVNLTETATSYSDTGATTSILTKDDRPLIDDVIATDEVMKADDVMTKNDVIAVNDVLVFLLPGLCHLTADDVARARLLELRLLPLLGQYFSRLVVAYTDHAVSLVTLCGVLLNLAVTERDVTGRDPAARALCAEVIAWLPALGATQGLLELRMNLAMLGLMLLNNQRATDQVPTEPQLPQTERDSPRGVITEPALRAFYDSCVTMLRQTHTGATLSPAYVPQWAELEELWFLAMQALTAALPHCTTLRQVLDGSGWLRQLATTLTTAPRHQSQVTCWQDLVTAAAQTLIT